MSSVLKGYLNFILKYVLITCVLAVILILSVMLKYQVSFDFIINNGSDPVIENDLRSFLDLKNIALDILQGFPLISKIPLVRDIFGAEVAYHTAIDNLSGIQKALFSDIIFALLSLAYFKVLLFIYSLIKKVTDNLINIGITTFFTDILPYLQIAYIGTISILLIRDFILDSLYKTSDILTFIVIIVAVIIASLIISIIKNIRKPAEILQSFLEYIFDTVLELLCVACIYLSVISLAVTMIPDIDKTTLSCSAVCSILSILGVVILAALKFAGVKFNYIPRKFKK